ncbi:nucleotide-binding universal stress UspA family protein [Rhodovulum imhoffii]|uniref:Nucleotide-binding universal stress UspA family protein n=1 Tax=Rhodovulum imhoffii TaxID=365340 RepID=A0A2T5BQV5_9RHOB|nr:universal stress protein [Rhodovulum imhoffii]MBK5932591.1 universal stress protein [Rhodovulum imhoffii]PTN01626.1 nucleotide-binding universal stress UspA family protein [Rhodovulum imhoffii]
MYKEILVPIAMDHGEHTPEVLEIARALRAEGGRITALSVIEAIPPYVSQYLPAGQEEKTRKEAREALLTLTGLDEDIHTKIVTGHPAAAILDYAQRHGTDCIIMASHRPGLQDYLLGSTAGRVVRHAACSVHVLR